MLPPQTAEIVKVYDTFSAQQSNEFTTFALIKECIVSASKSFEWIWVALIYLTLNVIGK